MYNDLAGKVALITGSGKRTGIGFAMARKLAQSSVHVILTDVGLAPGEDTTVKLGSMEEMQALASELSEECGVQTLALPLDVTQNASVEAAVRVVGARFGGLDILINNAGAAFGAPSPVKGYDDEAWMKTFDVNLHGVFRVSKRFLPMLAERKGCIINIASKAGKIPPILNGAYAVAKAAVIMLTKVMALEMARQGVRVNAICPALIMTDLQVFRIQKEAEFFQATYEDREKALAETVPMGYIAEPSQVAALAAYLASQESSYITGQAMNVCGGMTLAL